MRRIILAILVLAAFCELRAGVNVPLIRYQDTTTELFGFIDLEGKIIIPAKYQFIETDTFRVAAIVFDTNGRTVCIGRGQEVLFYPFTEDYTADRLESGSVRTIKDGKIGFADSCGREFIPPIYDFALPFSGEYAAFLSGGVYGSADGMPDSLSEHFSWTGGAWGVINKRNDTIIPPGIDNDLLEDLDIFTLTETDPKSSSFDEFSVGGKKYYIENVISSFENFLGEFIPMAAEGNTSYVKSHSFDFIDCSSCSSAPQENKKCIDREKVSPIVPIDEFINNYFNIVFAKDSMVALLDRKNCFFVCQLDQPSFLHAHGEDIGERIGLNKYYKYYDLTLVVNHQTAGGRYWQERYSFIKTRAGFKFFGYSASPWRDEE